MKILVTGAHFTTALAVIEELLKQPGVEIVYVGRKTTREGDPSPSAESQILPKRGVKFIPLITGRLQRSLTIYTIPSLLKIPIGLFQSLLIILSEKPDVVVSFGGYVALPLVIVAWLLSIPILIHEQTLVTGLSNKISSYFADKIAVSFSANHSFNRQKTFLSGNPLRKEFLEPKVWDWVDLSLWIIDKAKKDKLPVILVTGGNQGSHILNLALEQTLDNLLKIACVIHQTGDSKYRDFERLEPKQNDRYLVRKFFYEDMPTILIKADLVVSRAGINILTELAYLGKPTLVVPIPYLFADEQNKNAQYFEKLGLVKILPQSKLTGKSLLTNIKVMLKNLDFLNKQAKDAKASVIPAAAKRLGLETLILAERSQV